GLIAAGGFSIFSNIQQTKQAEAHFNETMRGADRYLRILNSTPKPSLATHAAAPSPVAAAPPAPPPQAQTYTIAVLKRPTSFQFPHGNVTLPRGSQLVLVSRNDSEVIVSYRGQQQSVPASDVDLR